MDWTNDKAIAVICFLAIGLSRGRLLVTLQRMEGHNFVSLSLYQTQPFFLLSVLLYNFYAFQMGKTPGLHFLTR